MTNLGLRFHYPEFFLEMEKFDKQPFMRKRDLKYQPKRILVLLDKVIHSESIRFTVKLKNEDLRYYFFLKGVGYL